MGSKFSGLYWGVTIITGFLIYLSPQFAGNKFPADESNHKITGVAMILIGIIGVLYRTYQWFQEED